MRAQLLTFDHLVQLMDPKLYLHLQSADSTNFFFFFRMLLVWYKREFEWVDVLQLWERLWTDWLSSSFHLFVALAILEKHRDVLMNHLKHFDEVLKYSMLLFYLSPTSDPYSQSRSSQRTLWKNRPPINPRPRRSPLPPLPAHRRSHRQEKQLPTSLKYPSSTRDRNATHVSRSGSIAVSTFFAQSSKGEGGVEIDLD